MHIILVSNRLAPARPLHLGTGHLALAFLGLLCAILAASWTLSFLTVRYAAALKLPEVDSLIVSVQAREQERNDTFLRQNLDALAMRLGQLQAQLTRLDALGERVSSLAGLKASEFRFTENPGRGGALSASLPPQSMSMNALSRALDVLYAKMENRNDQLGILENTLFDARIKSSLLPTVMPVEGNWNASSFGWRIDPFTGQNALHEGVDFIADIGTPIFAAAGGLVAFAGTHPQYGNMVEIDHGNGFITRYAHASRVLARQGEVVQRGRKIAEVGASGRATGPHLHFEVRYRGSAQDPTRFLRASAR
ncbi:MAG: M23 family metallopeptidase [Burkholderiales bacterium]|nr:M23 family metallopeptidase [Burkholderiales bacterium]